MATVNKDFKIKNGLVVEGTNATVNGNQILTETASDQYIIDLIGGETLITAVNTDDFVVNSGTLEIAVGSDLARTGDLPTNTDDITEDAGANNKYFTDFRAETAISNALGASLQYASEGAGNVFGINPTYLSNEITDGARSAISVEQGGSPLTYDSANGVIGIGIATSGGVNLDGSNDLQVNRDVVDEWYDASGAASTVQTNLDDHALDTGTHGVTEIVGASETQTLTNKTVGDELGFGTGQSYISENGATAGQLDVIAENDLHLESSNGNILLTPATGHHAYIGGATAENEIATHGYVDNAVAGLNWKQAVNLLATTPYSVGDDIDGHVVGEAQVGYRILLTGQVNPADNGIYLISAGDPAGIAVNRAADADAHGELVGAAVYVMEGTQYGSTSWVQSNHYLTNFTGQDWTQFSGQGSVTAGNGIVVDGLEVSIDTDVVATQTDLSTGLGTKQDTLTAGDGIEIGTVNATANTIYVSTVSGGGISSGPDGIEVARTTVDTWYDASGAASTAEDNANTYTDTQLQSYTPTSSLETTIDGYGFAYSSEIPGSTDSLNEGTTNLYYTDARVRAEAIDLLTNAQTENITIQLSGMDSLSITAENGVADSTTDDLDEGSTNLYFTEARAQSAMAGATMTPYSVEINNYRKEEATQQSVANASTVNVHSFSYPYESAKYLVRVVGWIGGVKHSQITEILMTIDGNYNIAMTEYGNVHTSTDPLATFSAIYNSMEDSYKLTATTAVAGCEIIAAATMLSWAD